MTFCYRTHSRRELSNRTLLIQAFDALTFSPMPKSKKVRDLMRTTISPINSVYKRPPPFPPLPSHSQAAPSGPKDKKTAATTKESPVEKVKKTTPPKETTPPKSKKATKATASPAAKKEPEEPKVRPSPSAHAKEHKGEQLVGNDGSLYESRADKRDVYTWKKVKVV